MQRVRKKTRAAAKLEEKHQEAVKINVPIW